MAEKNIDERSTAGASYILSFYKEVQELTHNYATYLNLMLEINTKYGSSTEEELNKNLEEQDKEILNKAVQLVRYSTHQVHIKYSCIKDHFKKPDTNTEKILNESYKKIKTTYIIPQQPLEQYTISINKILLTEIIQNLLNNSQELLGAIYNDRTEPN